MRWGMFILIWGILLAIYFSLPHSAQLTIAWIVGVLFLFTLSWAWLVSIKGKVGKR